MRQAAVLLTGGNAKDAIPLLERCYTLHPEGRQCPDQPWGAYILAGRHRRAVPLLEKAVELAPDNPSVWSNLAAAYLDPSRHIDSQPPGTGIGPPTGA